jgi:hypothetical protein
MLRTRIVVRLENQGLGVSFVDTHLSIRASPKISALRRMRWRWCAPCSHGRLLRARHLKEWDQASGVEDLPDTVREPTTSI